MPKDYAQRTALACLERAAEALDCKPCPRTFTHWLDRCGWYMVELDRTLQAAKDAEGEPVVKADALVADVKL